MENIEYYMKLQYTNRSRIYKVRYNNCIDPFKPLMISPMDGMSQFWAPWTGEVEPTSTLKNVTILTQQQYEEDVFLAAL